MFIGVPGITINPDGAANDLIISVSTNPGKSLVKITPGSNNFTRMAVHPIIIGLSSACPRIRFGRYVGIHEGESITIHRHLIRYDAK